MCPDPSGAESSTFSWNMTQGRCFRAETQRTANSIEEVLVMRRGIVGLCACALFFVGAAGQAKADLVVNGGFETGDFTGWTVAASFTFVDPASPGVGGAGGFATHSGSFYAAMGSVGALGTISQTLSTTT